MTERIKEIKHLQQDGTFKTYPIGADASNIDLQNGKTLEAALGEDYVKNTDYAAGAVGGVIKTGNFFNLSSTGNARATTITYAQYSTTVGNDAFISKGTLENVITGKDLTTKAYVDGLVGDIGTAIDEINGEVIGG